MSRLYKPPRSSEESLVPRRPTRYHHGNQGELAEQSFHQVSVASVPLTNVADVGAGEETQLAAVVSRPPSLSLSVLLLDGGTRRRKAR